MRDLIAEALLMRLHRLTRLLRQRQIGCEHLGVVAHLLVLDRKQRAQPALQPGGRRSRPFRDLLKRRVGAVEPALRHGLAQRSLARKMTIDAAVAHIERTGNIHDRGLGQPEATQHILGDFENSLGGQDHYFVHARTAYFSLPCAAICAVDWRAHAAAAWMVSLLSVSSTR